MVLGRNDTCHCGSGKKYKKCHLAEDERARSAARAPKPVLASTPPSLANVPAYEPPPPSPDQSRWDLFWKDFDAADLDAQLAITRRALAEEEDDDERAEFAFELVDKLAQPLQRAGRTSDLDSLMRDIDSLYPGAAARNAQWFSLWRMENALLTGGDALAPMLAWAPKATKLVDMFYRALDRLSFHGRLGEVAAIAAAAWPAVDGSHKLMDGGAELAYVATMAVVHRHLDERPELDRLDDSLRAEIAPYEEVLPDWIERFIKADRGLLPTPVGAADLAGDGANEAVEWLLVDFARELRTRWSWPRARAELARSALLGFFLRHLDESDAPPKASSTKKKGSRTAQVERTGDASTERRAEALLLPPAEVFDKGLARHFSFLALGSWRGLAMFAALPAWLTYVAERGLGRAEVAESRREALAALVSDIVQGSQNIEYDPKARAEVERAWAVES